MTYYIVMNEWNYPTESGREFVGDFDSSMDAEFAALSECNKEKKNFTEAVGEIDPSISGRRENGSEVGYVLWSSDNDEHFFYSVIIEREV